MDDPDPDEDSNASTTRDTLFSNATTTMGYKRRRNQAKPPFVARDGSGRSKSKTPSVVDVLATVKAKRNRKKKAKSSPEATDEDPALADPDYIRFMADMEDLKSHSMKIQDADEYWREVNGNADKEMEKLVKEERSRHAPGYSLAKHETKVSAAKGRKEQRKTGVTALPLPSIVESRESDYEDETPVESTPILPGKGKRRRLPSEVSVIAEESPLARTNKPFVRPKPPSKRKQTSGVSTPIDGMETNPIRLNLSAVQENSPIARQNLSRDFDAAEEEDDSDRIKTIASEAEVVPSPSRSQRRATAGSILTAMQPVPSTSRRSARGTATRQSQYPNTASSHGNANQTTPRVDFRIPTSKPGVTSHSSADAPVPSTPQQPPKQHRRDSLPIFSPAFVLREENLRILTELKASRNSRRSVVVNAGSQSPLQLLLQVSTPSKIINTDKILGSDYTDLRKIGEGSYADVYSTYRNGEEVVLKIVPVGGFYGNREPQTSFEDILSEALISKKLTTTLMNEKSMNFYAPVFARMHFVKIAQGPYPDEFGNKHDSFAREHEEDALNQHPAAYDEDQQYVILGFNNGGQPLDIFPLANYSQAKSVFQQIALGFAAAEQALEFEHRDAHISNILVQITTQASIRFCLNGAEYIIPTHGVQVTIIDCTLSRMKSDQQIVYKNLAEDVKIFKGHGDDQFDVYREMRAWNKNNWEVFEPKTNVRWLKYLQQKLLKEKTISDDPIKKDLKELNFKGKLLTFKSAVELVQRSAMFQHCLKV